MRKSIYKRDEAGVDFYVALFIEPLAKLYQLIVDSQQFVEVVFVDQHSGGENSEKPGREQWGVKRLLIRRQAR
jgi:hypothetical protein